MGTFVGTPSIFEQQMYLDSMTAFIPVNAATSNPSLSMIAANDIKGWTIAPISSTNASMIVGLACNLHLTPNFDLVRDQSGLNKEVNIDTSNLLTCQRTINLQSAMRIYAVTRWGDSYWFKVQGAAEQEVLMPCTCVYIVPDSAPSVIL